MTSEESWDFFISFASPDQARAAELADLLERQGWKVFFSARNIDPGEDWNGRLQAALRGSRVVVVLLTENTAKAHYQREEIALAIRLSRPPGSLKVVPVYLDGIPQEPASWEFGSLSLQRIDFDQLGAVKSAEQLGDLLLHPPPAAEVGSGLDPDCDRPDPGHRELHTVGEMLHGASLRINRTKQWGPLLKICSSSANALFLLHGPKRQNLDLFILRIWYYLAQESRNHQRTYMVRLRVGFAKPRSAAGWENNLKLSLTEEGRGEGTAEELLREAARAHPVFLVLSKVPIEVGDLDPVELEALGDFLSLRLPRLIADASAGHHPIRALLATHYESAAGELVEQFDTRARRGAEHHGLRYWKLPPLQPLEWSDIEEFLDGLPEHPPEKVYTQLRKAFDSLDRGSLQFREVVALLERQLY